MLEICSCPSENRNFYPTPPPLVYPHCLTHAAAGRTACNGRFGHSRLTSFSQSVCIKVFYCAAVPMGCTKGLVGLVRPPVCPSHLQARQQSAGQICLNVYHKARLTGMVVFSSKRRQRSGGRPHGMSALGGPPASHLLFSRHFTVTFSYFGRAVSWLSL